jgi:hypothetical protein
MSWRPPRIRHDAAQVCPITWAASPQEPDLLTTASTMQLSSRGCALVVPDRQPIHHEVGDEDQGPVTEGEPVEGGGGLIGRMGGSGLIGPRDPDECDHHQG